MIANSRHTLKSMIFPVRAAEMPRIFPLFCLFFLISFIYNLLRPLKISLVVNAPGAGAEVTAFIKAWAILPMAFVLAWVYTVLSKRMSQQQVFYCFLSFFIGFFLFFCAIYPNRNNLELLSLSNFLIQILPKGLHGLAIMIRHWDLTMFYAIAELWGNIMLTVLAWGLANSSITFNDAKRFYAFLAVGADSAGIFSGQFGRLINYEELSKTIIANMISIVGIACVIAYLYHIVIKNSYKQSSNHISKQSFNDTKPIVNTKNNMGMLSSIKTILKSKYLFAITIIVVAYNVCFNLFDIFWIDQLKRHFNNASKMNDYLHYLSSVTGILAASIAFFVSGNLIRKLGWKAAAIITPVIIFGSSILFFCNILFNDNYFLYSIWSILGNPLGSSIILFGTLQYCLTRACKYTLYDSTKEMAYIPLPEQEKRNSKVIIDTIVSRGSKATGSYLIQGLLMMCSSLLLTIPWVAGIILLMLLAWFIAIWVINNDIKQLMLPKPSTLNNDNSHTVSIHPKIVQSLKHSY